MKAKAIADPLADMFDADISEYDFHFQEQERLRRSAVRSSRDLAAHPAPLTVVTAPCTSLGTIGQPLSVVHVDSVVDAPSFSHYADCYEDSEKWPRLLVAVVLGVIVAAIVCPLGWLIGAMLAAIGGK
jgi:ABC-type Fe3+ transport system permease subunit